MATLKTLLTNVDINIFLSLGAFIISIIALVYTVKTFILKSGLKIRCSLTTCSSIDCDDKYISSITLENIKDRSTVIFKIYLRFKHNVYIEIEDFSEKPLILKPFEVYFKEYDPVLFYSSGTQFVKVDHLLNNQKIQRSIILSTTNGKYKVRTYISGFDAISTSLRNFYTLAVTPRRLEYNNKAYGPRIRYLIDLKYDNGERNIIPVHKSKEYHKVFKNIDFTMTALQSKENLEKFMLKQKRLGKFKFSEIKVIDYEQAVGESKEVYKTEPYVAETCGYFEYSIVGKIVTKIEDYKLWKKNRENRRKNGK